MHPTRWLRPLRVAALALSLALVACAQPSRHTSATAPASMGGVPAVRLARLARCVDVTRWFWEASDPAPRHYSAYLSDADLELIHRLGFRCVRLSIDPDLLYHKATPAAIDPVMLGYVDAAVDRLLAHDLAVTVDMHDDPLKLVEQDPDYARGFVVFWRALAHHFSRRDPDMVFLEVLNEPVYQQAPRQWQPMQQRLLDAMRAGAPRMTLIATGPLWSSVDGLTQLHPAADADVVYTFHFYEPATFTHEGAAWVVDGLDRYLRGLPYPAASSRCAAAATKFVNADVRATARAYCASDWDAARIDALVARAAGWSRANRVPIIAGEFGAYCGYAPPADRLRWFEDVRSAFQAHGIGWTLWGYDDCYGLGRRLDPQGHIAIDWGVVRALGLDAGARSAAAPLRRSPDIARPAPA